MLPINTHYTFWALMCLDTGARPRAPASTPPRDAWRIIAIQLKRKSDRENLRVLRATWRPSPESCEVYLRSVIYRSPSDHKMSGDHKEVNALLHNLFWFYRLWDSLLGYDVCGFEVTPKFNVINFHWWLLVWWLNLCSFWLCVL